MRLDQEAQRPQTRTHYVTQRPLLTSDIETQTPGHIETDCADTRVNSYSRRAPSLHLTIVVILAMLTILSDFTYSLV